MASLGMAAGTALAGAAGAGAAGSAAAGVAGAAAGTYASQAMGGDGGGGYERKRDSRYSPAQQRFMGELLGEVTPQIGKGVEPPPDTIPEPTAGQQRAAQYGQTYLEQVIPQMRQRGEELMQPDEWDPERAQERWRQTVVQPSRQQWREQAVPQIMEQYASRNALSSSAVANALAESREDMTTQNMATLAELTYRDYERFRNQSMQEQKMGTNLLQQTLGAAGQAGGLTAVPRQVEQAQMEEEAQQWAYGQPYANPWLDKGMQTLGAQPMTTSYISKPQSSGWQQAAQTVAPTLGRTLGSMNFGGGGQSSPGGMHYSDPMVGLGGIG